MDKIAHPGIKLAKLIQKSDYSQRELASTLNIAHSLLNNVIKGNRNINVHLAISLEAAGFMDANYWLSEQMSFSLKKARSNSDVQKQNSQIKNWEEVGELIPLSFIKKQECFDISSSEDVGKIFDLFKVADLDGLKSKVKNYNPVYFRKSSKFSEIKSHILTWSTIAEEKASLEKVSKFNINSQETLLNELKNCLFKNTKTIKIVRQILNSFGIKFIIQDRPSKTPVDGKSFISGNNPAIALTLKYKRLDNFAFTLFHELGHVFLHLAPNLESDKVVGKEFFVNNSINSIEEFEADKFAQDNLIQRDLWTDFIILNESFKDSVIYEFANENKIHPAIVRGRVCHEFPEYYKKRTAINNLNRLDLSN